MKLLKTIFLVLITFSSLDLIRAQNTSPFSRTYIDTLPKRFELDVSELRNYIYQDIPDPLRKESFPRRTYRFADLSSIQISNLLSSGVVYNDWPKLEDYVNKILEKVVPPEYKGKEYLQVYVMKRGDFNAFMTPSGMIFINIGLFADLEDEATLAGILAHEIAHHYLRHSMNEYIKAERGEFKPNIFLNNKDAHSNFSIKSELEADSLAFKWVTDSGYTTNGLFEAFKINERHEEQLLAQYLDLWEITATTHPTSDERLSKLEAFSSISPETEGKDFMVSKKAFSEFKKQAKSEILKYLLINFDYLECIEKAFVFHLYDLENPAYVYYLMEAIRKVGYLDAKFWSKDFITFTYLKEIKTKEGRKKVRMDAHIFEEFPTKILALPPDAKDKIQGKFYWEGEPKFTTNEEAFSFFAKVGKLYNNPECLLSQALSYSFNKETMKKYLEKYLEHKNIENREYAENLLNGSLKSNLKNEKLTVLSGFNIVVKQGKEEIPIHEDAISDIKYLNKRIDEIIASFDNRTLILLSDLKYSKMNDYLLMSELERFSLISLLAYGQQTDLFIFDPKYWKILNRLGVNEMEFINCQYYDNRKKESKLEPYIEVTNTDLKTLFSEVKKHRYFEVLISSVRAIEDVSMKTLYYGGEEKLTYNASANEQIFQIIKDKIQQKDIEIKEFDDQMKKRDQK